MRGTVRSTAGPPVSFQLNVLAAEENTSPCSQRSTTCSVPVTSPACSQLVQSVATAPIDCAAGIQELNLTAAASTLTVNYKVVKGL